MFYIIREPLKTEVFRGSLIFKEVFMGNSAGGGNKRKKDFSELMEGKFFTFSSPYLELVSKGKLFNFIYIVIAVINLIIPFLILYKVIDSGFFSLGAKYVFAFILTWFVIVFACWIGFQLWWNRRENIINIEMSEFYATMFLSEILKTSGEWLGTMTAIIGAGGGLLASIFLGNDVDYLFRTIGMGFLHFGVLIVIVAPITGIFIILLSRFIAEQIRLCAALARNTKEIADNIKSKGSR